MGIYLASLSMMNTRDEKSGADRGRPWADVGVLRCSRNDEIGQVVRNRPGSSTLPTGESALVRYSEVQRGSLVRPRTCQSEMKCQT